MNEDSIAALENQLAAVEKETAAAYKRAIAQAATDEDPATAYGTVIESLDSLISKLNKLRDKADALVYLE